MLVNKDNKMPKSLEITLEEANSKYKEGVLIEKKTLENFKLLKESARNNGYLIDIESGFRTHEYQQKLFDNLVLKKGIDYAKKYIAKPYTSEHETGLAIDVCLYDDGWKIEHNIKNEQYINWLHNNCYRYGFILRYKEGKENITGYNHEPWHLRYVGKEVAKIIYEEDLTLEEYLDKYEN